MIVYSQISAHTNTASPRPYLAAHGIDAACQLTESGWICPDWPAEYGDQPSAQTVLDWQPPQPEQAEPLTDVEIATNNFRQARLAAPAALDSLKGAVWAGLVAGGLAPDEATAAGVGLVLLHGPLLAAFEAAGGHPVAGQALYAAISSPESVAALPWLTEGILAIFAAALAPG